MTTENFDPSLAWLLQSDWRDTIIPGLGREPWITVYLNKVTEEEKSDDFPIMLDHQDDLTFYELRADSAKYLLGDKHKSLSYLLGKKLIPPFSLDRCGIWPFDEKEEEDYIEFITFTKHYTFH